jgi:nitroreductase
MSFQQLATDRYSVRTFKADPVSQEQIDAILQAGRIAPTACNNQPQRIKVIQNADELAKIDECTTCRFDAPLVLLICYDSSASWVRPFDKENSGTVDASIVTTHLTLQAAELGLGSTWVMYFDPAKIKSAFNLPENIVPVALLPIGHPAEEAKPAPLHSSKKPIESILI